MGLLPSQTSAISPSISPAASISGALKPFSQYIIRVFRHSSEGPAVPLPYSAVTLAQDDTDDEVDEEKVAPGKLKYDRLVQDGGLREPHWRIE